MAAGTAETEPPRNGQPRRVAPPAVLGALAMIGSVLFFTLLDTTNKILVATYNPFFLAWARCVAQVIMMLAILPLFTGTRMFQTQRPLLHLARGLCIAAVSVCVTLSVHHFPLTETYVVGFLTPFLATVLAALFLAERATPLQWALISSAFVGVLIALRPTGPDASWHLLYPLGFAVSNSVYFVLTRLGGRTEKPLAQLFYVGVFAALALTLALPWTWETPQPHEWAMIGLVGVFGMMGHMLLITAFSLAPTAVVAPMVYFQIIWSSAIGYIVFADLPLATTWIGAAIIVVSGILLIRSQAR